MGYLKFLIIGLLALAACTPVSRAVVGEGIGRVEQANDAAARLALKAPCAITVGAKNRALTADEQRHVEGLCGGNTERPVTIEELQRFLAAPR